MPGPGLPDTLRPDNTPTIPFCFPGLEEPEVHGEALSADGEGPSPLEPATQARCQGPVEELPLDVSSESSQYLPLASETPRENPGLTLSLAEEKLRQRGSGLSRLPTGAAGGARAQAGPGSCSVLS